MTQGLMYLVIFKLDDLTEVGSLLTSLGISYQAEEYNDIFYCSFGIAKTRQSEIDTLLEAIGNYEVVSISEHIY